MVRVALLARFLGHWLLPATETRCLTREDHLKLLGERHGVPFFEGEREGCLHFELAVEDLPFKIGHIIVLTKEVVKCLLPVTLVHI